MDGEVGALVESLRAGARRLASDLAAVETGMDELYDAASGRGRRRPARQALPPAAAAAGRERRRRAAAARRAPPRARRRRAARRRDRRPPRPPPPSRRPRSGKEPVPGDLDGARLVALNMALNGESRAETERYLAENFELPDRLKLIDEVYAAIEG